MNLEWRKVLPCNHNKCNHRLFLWTNPLNKIRMKMVKWFPNEWLLWGYNGITRTLWVRHGLGAWLQGWLLMLGLWETQPLFLWASLITPGVMPRLLCLIYWKGTHWKPLSSRSTWVWTHLGAMASSSYFFHLRLVTLKANTLILPIIITWQK